MISAKTVKVPVVEEDEDEDDWYDDLESVEIEYWVGIWPEDDRIECSTDGVDLGMLEIEYAERVAKAVLDLVKWSKSKAGLKKIEKTREVVRNYDK